MHGAVTRILQEIPIFKEIKLGTSTLYMRLLSRAQREMRNKGGIFCFLYEVKESQIY